MSKKSGLHFVAVQLYLLHTNHINFMKFIVSSSALLKQLQQINGVIGSNNVLPILEDFLFEN